MFSMQKIIFVLLLVPLAILALATLYALPAVLSLPSGPRSGLGPMTIEEAVAVLRASDKSGWALIEAARALVGQRMRYGRRNNWEHYRKAFARGMGFCQQRAFALRDILQQLGFQARVVQALRNRFPDGKVSGHAWVQVYYVEEDPALSGEAAWIDIDPEWYDPITRRLTTQPLTRVTRLGGLFRIFSGWGSGVVNAHVYYREGEREAL